MRSLGSGGTALPGLVVERLHPHAARQLASRLGDTALVTGTNGKTTTAAMLASILRADGRDPVIHNRSGSNLLRGVTAALVDAASPLGLPPARAPAVLEADEAALHSIAQAAPPTVAIFTNLMRDQLDRYGEIESIARRWTETLAHLPPDAALALNVDDPLVASLEQGWDGPVVRFGIEDDAVPDAPDGDISDAVWDPTTHDDIQYSRRYFAQLGRWHTRSGRSRPTPAVCAEQIAANEHGMSFRLSIPDGHADVALSADGLYSVYNALAAAAGAVALGISSKPIARGLEAYQAAFGRQEDLSIHGRRVRLLLAKNPSGMNQALRTLQRPGTRHHLLVLLNDGIADGTDVSWIWDVDWESQAPYCRSLTVGGRRAADMALRLEYAGLPAPAAPPQVDVGRALRQAFDAVQPDDQLIILPTYTAMLDVRQRLGRMGATNLWDAAA